MNSRVICFNFIISIIFLLGCKSKTFSVKVKTIYTENIEAIEYEDYTESKICFRTSDAKIINQIVKSINEANIEGPYKGCCWNKIKIIYGDSTIKLFTDGIVFSDVGSGTFYKFNKPFFENLMRE